MLDLTGPALLLVVLAYLGAGVVKGVTGMGLPIVAMAVLGGLMPPTTAAAVLIAPSMVTNVWQLVTGPSFGATVRRLWPMMTTGSAATILVAATVSTQVGAWATAILGAVLAAYAALGLTRWRLVAPPRHEAWLKPLIGAVTGVVAGFTGVFSIPAVPYLQAMELDKDDLVQALGLLFTVSTVALAIGLAAAGVFDRQNMTASLLAIPPAMAGVWIGTRLRDRIDAATFRRWFLIILLVMGVQLLTRPFL